MSATPAVTLQNLYHQENADLEELKTQQFEKTGKKFFIFTKC